MSIPFHVTVAVIGTVYFAAQAAMRGREGFAENAAMIGAFVGLGMMAFFDVSNPPLGPYLVMMAHAGAGAGLGFVFTNATHPDRVRRAKAVVAGEDLDIRANPRLLGSISPSYSEWGALLSYIVASVALLAIGVMTDAQVATGLGLTSLIASAVSVSRFRRHSLEAKKWIRRVRAG